MELLTTGKVTLPIPEPWRGWLRAVREGGSKLDVVLTAAGKYERELEDLLTASPLPPEPDYERINRFLLDAYLGYW